LFSEKAGDRTIRHKRSLRGKTREKRGSQRYATPPGAWRKKTHIAIRLGEDMKKAAPPNEMGKTETNRENTNGENG